MDRIKREEKIPQVADEALNSQMGRILPTLMLAWRLGVFIWRGMLLVLDTSDSH